MRKIGDAKLRAGIEAEIAALKSRTRFGLVYERHLPETVLVGDVDGLMVGDHVRPREEADNVHDYGVVALDDRHATIASLKTGEERQIKLTDTMAVRRFGDPADVGLTPLGTVAPSGNRPYHAVIEGENFHVLQLLTFVYERQVDCLYIATRHTTRVHETGRITMTTSTATTRTDTRSGWRSWSAGYPRQAFAQARRSTRYLHRRERTRPPRLLVGASLSRIRRDVGRDCSQPAGDPRRQLQPYE